MQVKITIEVDGQKVCEQVESVAGTLEEMEERVIVMARAVGRDTLQAAINMTPAARPPFRPNWAACETRALRPGR